MQMRDITEWHGTLPFLHMQWWY